MWTRKLLPIPPALPLSALATLLLTPPAFAHRLNASFHVFAGPQVQVEAWYSDGKPPTNAKVHVYSANGQTLFSEPGVLNAKGVFLFNVTEIEPLKIDIAAPGGHSVTLHVSADELRNPTSRNDTPGEPRSDRTSGVTFQDILLGVTFLLALAAFLMSLRCAQQLHRLLQLRTPDNERQRPDPR